MAALSAVRILRPFSLSSYKPSSPFLSPSFPAPSFHRMAALSAVRILRPFSLSSYKPSSPFLSPSFPAPSFHPIASSEVSFASSKASRLGPRAISTVVLTGQKPLSPTSPVVTRDEALMLYEDMVLARRFEEMCAEMYNLGKIFGYVHLYIGQEAVAAGFIKLLTQRDAVVGTYRCHVHALCKGVPLRPMMAELFGRTTGLCRGQGGSMHMFYRPCNFLGGFGFIGEGIPIATGAAFGAKYRHDVLKESSPEGLDVAIVFFGDGTSNIGQFFECLNMAQLWKLPVIFVVENNQWSLMMSHFRAASETEIWKKGPAFGMPGVRVDGMDVLEVREVAKEAIARARRGEGPTLVECETYRFKGHSMYDKDEDDHRDPDERAHYAARDPIMALKKHILEQDLASESELKAIEEKVNDVVKDAVEFADSSPHPPRSQLLENVFADPKGFGIGPDGKYRCEDPSFAVGTAEV